MEASLYLPTDRRLALVQGRPLPEYSGGTALFADISGFTPLTEALVRALGARRGPEELTLLLNQVYDALIAQVDRYGGSVLGFAGDSITCWFDADTGLRATACALAMQAAMGQFARTATPTGETVIVTAKVALATGPVRRFLVGDPGVQLIDVLAGQTLDQLARAEQVAQRGEVVLDPSTLAALGDEVSVVAWRSDTLTGSSYGVIDGLRAVAEEAPWPILGADALHQAQVRPWLLPPVWARLAAGQGEFLAELRPATALFLRFGGIDYDDDPDAAAKLDSFVRDVQGILARCEGFLIQLSIGDKGAYLYAAFGAPIAHEDDAARAATAALELRVLAQGLPFIDDVQIGISQGRMRVGAYGGTTRRTYGVLGDEVNLAARLMQAAAPGQIVVSDRIYKATAAAPFEWQPLGPLRVKGKSEPVGVWQLIGLRQRHHARLHEPRYTLPIVGRAAELALLSAKFEQTRRGRGQVVGITGEAGIGKSRLVAEGMRLALASGYAAFAGECQSYGTNASYLVWRSIWRDLFGLDAADTLQQQTQALQTQLLAVDANLVPRLPLLGPLLGLAIPDNELTRSFDAKLRKTALESLLAACLRARAAQEPLLLVLEDCHWIDPLSHDLLETLGHAVARLPVLLLLAYRPFEVERLQAPRVTALAHFSQLSLFDLEQPEAEQLIAAKLAQLVGDQVAAPRRLVERVAERSQGNPFYIEELLNYLHDQRLDLADVRVLEQLDMPSSLERLVLSRIDRLSEGQRTTLRLASIIGRVFAVDTLLDAYPQIGDPAQVRADLDVLNRLDVTPLDTPDPHLSYLFRHIVTHEVAYGSMPYATRAGLHEQLARFIEERHSEADTPPLDLLAFHYDRSGNALKRREYLRRAGEAAQASYANDAALDYFARLLPLLDDDQRGEVLLRLGQVLELLGRWDEAGARYRETLTLAESVADRLLLARCHVLIGDLLRKQGQYEEAADWLAAARVDFEALGDKGGLAQAFNYLGVVDDYRGNYEQARGYFEASLMLRRELNDQNLIAITLNNLSIVARYLADIAEARAICEESLSIRRTIGDAWGTASSLDNLGMLALDQEDYSQAQAFIEEALVINRKVGDRSAIAISLNNLGNAVRGLGDYGAAWQHYEEALQIDQELGDQWALCYLLEDIGCLAGLQAQPERALRLVGAAAALRETIGAPLAPPEQASLNKLLASVRQALSPDTQAALLAEGRALTLDAAIAYALEHATQS